jgi:hypothetical protein
MVAGLREMIRRPIQHNRRTAPQEERTDFGNAEILAIGHGDPITEGAAQRIRELVG